MGPELIDGRGRVVVPGFTVARRLVASLVTSAAGEGTRATAPRAGDLVALAVLDDVYRALLLRYLQRHDSGVLVRALERIASALGSTEVITTLARFSDAFGLRPSLPADLDQAIEAARGGKSESVDQRLFLEFVLFWLQWRNPAAKPLAERLHTGFEVTPVVRRLLDEVERFLASCPGMHGASLAEDLLAPMTANPESLAAQLEFLKRVWGEALGEDLWRIQSALDLIVEETAPRWGGDESPPVEAPGLPVEAEKRYSPDREWMPRLVLAAKNTLVWLHQLSEAYGRDISTLDQIPEAELELLAGRGISGLWLIGLWERSRASSEIKRRRGNPEAAASAYSLRSYRIGEEFGGDEALEVLRRRAERHGVRLAADMVPNHMGIDSDWVLDHPERFVQVPESPYPAYSFAGPDLSPRPDVGIFLEDHYYDSTDAAVVFRRLDHATGEERFVYHGNDGTSMPWNDTAQLDYLDPAVREAVIETILDVARRFSVIRFDAAMTLAKRHYHRLWHPQPGDAGAIPSRSEHGLSRAEFDRRMPREFWREVVDRAASEAPDTLLLAEAFWLMEGYFVRTLGLHRVYNSAFMHMMRDQETGKYRRLLKETLEFDPEILRRYVNFMSNPDEESAADQFDLGDRYFGVCTVLATLPGLPMLAHGQWDGLREKYGMEYRRSYRPESPERHVIERHDREIAPLLRRRALFAEVDRFRLYDFHDRWGSVREDVLAYSNGRGSESALVVFNNSPHRVAGSLRESAPTRISGAEGGLETGTIYDALPLPAEGPAVSVLRDSVRELSVLSVPTRTETSRIDFELEPFSVLVFDGFDTVEGETAPWRELAESLRGRPVADPELELALFRAGPLLDAISKLAGGMIARETAESGSAEQLRGALERGARAVETELDRYLEGPPFGQGGSATHDRGGRPGAHGDFLAVGSERVLVAGLEPSGVEAVCAALALAPILETIAGSARAAGLSDELGRVLAGRLRTSPEANEQLLAILRVAASERWLEAWVPPGVDDLAGLAAAWTGDEGAKRVMGVNVAEEVEWLTLEGLRFLLAARRAFAVSVCRDSGGAGIEEDVEMVGLGWRLASQALVKAAAQAEYRLVDWSDLVAAAANPVRRKGNAESPSVPTMQSR